MTLPIDLGLHNLRAAYRAGTLDCRAVIEDVLARIAAAGDDKVWIARVPDAVLRAQAAALDARRGEIDALPLYGIPFAVKDNIDVAGLATTAGTVYRLADLEREPVLYNSHLGHYTNFVNFFGLSALALPFGFRLDGMPFGITLVGRGFTERTLLAFGAKWQRGLNLPLGKTASKLPPLEGDPVIAEDRLAIAVVGAHMSGLPLNPQLTDLGGRRESVGKTAPLYRFYALPGGPPHRPGMVRVSEGGGAIDLEVWSLPSDKVGAFVRRIPAPLGLGTVTLADGSAVLGFLCETHAVAAARDITALGGWRAYVKSLPV